MYIRTGIFLMTRTPTAGFLDGRKLISSPILLCSHGSRVTMILKTVLHQIRLPSQTNSHLNSSNFLLLIILF